MSPALKLVNEIISDIETRNTQDVQLEIQYATRAFAAIERICGKESPYYKQCVVASHQYNHIGTSLPTITSILRGVKADLEGGYLLRMQQLHHAEVFADFMEMASHLLELGYKDPAAVLVGGTLETHLRELAKANGVDPNAANGKPKKAEQLNQDLASAGVFLATEQKAVTSWLDLRNLAAHAKWDQYAIEQIKIMHMGVSDFLVRYPA